jgi:ATP-dependent RNA helicase RhlE
MTKFSGLDLIEPIQRAIRTEGYEKPTPIQAQSIPHLLEDRDLLGVAQTGTGKTAAFVLPLLQRLSKDRVRRHPGTPRALILTPTRELAGQIQDSVKAYGRNLKLRSLVVFGGVPINRQIGALKGGVDILVATPGRLLDLMNQGHVHLGAVEVFILDEADRMLDMGFIHDVRKVAAKVPADRQTVLFSATMPKTVQSLADGLLREPVRVEVTPPATTAERIAQRVLFVEKANKRKLLSHLMDDEAIARVLVFTRTKHGADRVAKHLERDGVRTGVIHGNKAQNARERALKGFKSGQLRVLVATDIAARGIDVDGVTHVINFELPNEPESYVHRIGRTARGGAEGEAISLCDVDEKAYLAAIEKTTRQMLAVHDDHPYHDEAIALAAPVKPKGRSGGRGGRPGGRPGGGRPKHGKPGKPQGAGKQQRSRNRNRKRAA